VFLGNFFDILLKQQRWRILGSPSDGPSIPYPCNKLLKEGVYYVESWDGRRVRLATDAELAFLHDRVNSAATVLESALRWHFGLGPHEKFFDPVSAAYAKRTANLV
jgi:hypothetical protein